VGWWRVSAGLCALGPPAGRAGWAWACVRAQGRDSVTSHAKRGGRPRALLAAGYRSPTNVSVRLPAACWSVGSPR